MDDGPWLSAAPYGDSPKSPPRRCAWSLPFQGGHGPAGWHGGPGSCPKRDHIFGEEHTNALSHKREFELLTELYRLVPDRLVLSLEMFEKDVQASLDAYLAGRMTEMEFLKVSRPWPNYERDYRHLVEFAKRRGFPSLRPMCRAASLPMWSNMAVQPAWFWKTPSTCPKTLNR